MSMSMWSRILSKEFADEHGDKIRMDRLLDLPNVAPPMNPSTIYITVVDKDRNACSFINSIAHSFGSAIVSNKTGILLQNRAGGFRVQPGHPNCIAPGKRPLHTIIPSLVTKAGRAVMPFGVMGGQYQPVGQVHVLTNMLDYGCDVQEAIDMPRGLHYEGVYQLEDGVPADIVEGLKKLGHKTTSVVSPLGGGQAIWIDWDKGTLTGGSDPRKDGCALGVLRVARASRGTLAPSTVRRTRSRRHARNRLRLGALIPRRSAMPIFHFDIADGVRLEDPVGLDCKNENDAKKTADLIARQIAVDIPADSEDRAVLVVDETGSEIYKAPVKPDAPCRACGIHLTSFHQRNFYRQYQFRARRVSDWRSSLADCDVASRTAMRRRTRAGPVGRRENRRQFNSALARRLKYPDLRAA